MKYEIKIGDRFDRLEVVSFSHKEGKFLFFSLKCDCGNTVTRRKDHLIKGRNQSCACLRQELAKTRTTKHGQAGKTPEYNAWAHMLRRCYTPTTQYYENYGGRGIQVCDRWRHSFENFLADMGKRPSSSHSLDRINNDGNYEPSNCRWATAKEQSNNRRVNHLLTFNNETLTHTQWEEKLGFSRGVISRRLRAGWSIKDTLTLSVKSVKHSSLELQGEKVINKEVKRVIKERETRWIESA